MITTPSKIIAWEARVHASQGRKGASMGHSKSFIRIEFHNCEPRIDANGDASTTIHDAIEFTLPTHTAMHHPVLVSEKPNGGEPNG